MKARVKLMSMEKTATDQKAGASRDMCSPLATFMADWLRND